jgi:hypothetical protein
MTATDKVQPASTEPARPGLLKQLIPFVFAIGILVWVFTGLSANVVDERLTLNDHTPTRLAHLEAKPETITLTMKESGATLCIAQEGMSGAATCPDGVDAYWRTLTEGGTFLIRSESGRIPSGAMVSVDYVYTLNPGELKAQLSEVSLALFFPSMLILCLVFFLADVFSFGYAYRRFNVPGMAWRELMTLRGGPYLVQIGLAPLAEILFPLYLYRVKKVPVAHALSSNIWTLVNDLAATATIITPAVIYNVFMETMVPAVGTTWLVGCAIFWLVYVAIIVYFTGIGKRREPAACPSILRSFFLSTGRDFAQVYAVRMVLWITFVVASFVTLRAVGIDPSMQLAMIGIPLVVMSIFLPIGVGGYGGPQLIAWFVFVEVGQAGSAETVILYSLLFSTAFLVGRAIIGLIFFWSFWRRVSQRKLTEQTIPAIP